MILRRGEYQIALTIGDRKDRRLLPRHELLDDNDPAGVTERIAGKHRLESLDGLNAAGSDHHSLACGETARFEHEWVALSFEILPPLLQILRRECA